MQFCRMLLKIALYFLSFLHPFFVSVIDLAYNEKGQSLEISIKIFTDDFEAALRQKFPNTKPDLMRVQQGALEDSLINRYIQQKLMLTINGQRKSMQYVGYEKQEESIWTYLEIPNISAVQSLEVTTTLLHEYKKEQINIIHAKVGNEKKSYRLDNPASTVSFKY